MGTDTTETSMVLTDFTERKMPQSPLSPTIKEENKNAKYKRFINVL